MLTEGSYFWAADNHITKTIRDIRVDILINAIGEAGLEFNTHAIGLLETGATGTAMIEGAVLPREDFKAGTLFFAPKGAKIIGRPSSPVNITVLIIPEHWFERAFKTTGTLKNCQYGYFEIDGGTVLSQAIQLLRAIAVESPRRALPSLIDSLIASIVIRLLSDICETVPQDIVNRSETLTENQLALIATYIDSNVDRSIRLRDLSKLVGRSESHFSRSFKAVMNVPPMRYVLMRRVELAKSYLERSNESLVSIALACGFASQSHFTTAFRQFTGMTPAVYRAGLKAALGSLLSRFLVELAPLLEFC